MQHHVGNDTDGNPLGNAVKQRHCKDAQIHGNRRHVIVASGCTSWDPNAALFACCPQLCGKWKLIDNPCRGENADKTFFGQSSYIFEADGKFYLMLDHWKPDNLKKSGYSILPIEVTKDNCLLIPWQEEWLGI